MIVEGSGPLISPEDGAELTHLAVVAGRGNIVSGLKLAGMCGLRMPNSFSLCCFWILMEHVHSNIL